MGDTRGTRVYVGGLSSSIKKEDIEDEFRKFGKVNNVWVAFNPAGFAFVEFLNRDDAMAACDSLNHSTILGSKLRVEISRARGRGGGGGGRRGGPRGGRSSFRGRDDDRGFSRGGRGSFERSSSFRGRGGSSSSRRGSSSGRYDDFDSSRSRSTFGSSSRGVTSSTYGGRSSRDDYDRDGYSGRDGYSSNRAPDSGYRGSRGSTSYSGGGGGGGGSTGGGSGARTVRDTYDTNGYYGDSTRSSGARYRSRSPVGRGSTTSKNSEGEISFDIFESYLIGL